MMDELESVFIGKNVRLVKAISYEWLANQEQALDWAYIDTDHSYETTMRELRASLWSVKLGGFICGHDYSPLTAGVMRAVHEFCTELALDLVVYTNDPFPSFLIPVRVGLDARQQPM